MTTEHKKGEFSARQEFRITHMLEAYLAYMNTGRSICEWVDNALDETPVGARCEVVVEFNPNPRNPKLRFENKNTTGMPLPKMQSFPIWGERHTDPSQIKEWGLGGKLAAIYWLSQSGSVSITSVPKGERDGLRMEIRQWWQHLTPEDEFPIEPLEKGSLEEIGFTRLELTGIKAELIPTNLGSLADHLGLTYGPLIDSGRLRILLRRLKVVSETPTDIWVLPIVVPFDPEKADSKNVGAKEGKVRMELNWGVIDSKERQRQALERGRLYGYRDPAKADSPQGAKIYLYYHGRLLSIDSISALSIARTTTGSVQSFAAVVDITEGWAPKNVLKTGLSLSASHTHEIYARIKREIQPHVLALARESDTTTISGHDRKKIADAGKKFQMTLMQIFENNTREIAKAFGITTSGVIYQAPTTGGGEKGKESKSDKEKDKGTLTVPGIRSTSEGEKRLKRPPKNPVPDFSYRAFPENYPATELDESQGILYIFFNTKSPVVRNALRARGEFSTVDLIHHAAWALYHQKWIRLKDANSQEYELGMQQDVANFLEMASKLELI